MQAEQKPCTFHLHLKFYLVCVSGVCIISLNIDPSKFSIV